MNAASGTMEKSRGGHRIRWEDDPSLIREYLRIYREVKVDGVPVATVARDYDYHRTHIYWIVAEVEAAMESGDIGIRKEKYGTRRS